MRAGEGVQIKKARGDPGFFISRLRNEITSSFLASASELVLELLQVALGPQARTRKRFAILLTESSSPSMKSLFPLGHPR